MPADPHEMVLLLRDRRTPADTLGRLARDRRWTRYHAVRRALALHANTPPPVARNLLRHLNWSDLAEAATEVRLHPLVRRSAERMLAERLEEMTVGQRIALARRAGRGLVPDLLRSTEPRVLAALLDNPRLVEAEAADVAAAAAAPAELLERLAAHVSWGRSRAVRLALVRNRRTPVPTALRIVRSLDPGDLPRLVDDDRVATIVRVSAERRLV